MIEIDVSVLKLAALTVDRPVYFSHLIASVFLTFFDPVSADGGIVFVCVWV